MRAVAVASIAVVAACSGEPEVPAAWPILQTFQFAPDGVDRESSCQKAQHLARWSYRDLAKTDIRVDGGETDTCVIPVEHEREQFVLQSVTCRRTDHEPRRVDVDLTVHFGLTGGIVSLPFPGAPSDRPDVVVQDRSFGGGLVVVHDITAFAVGGQGQCQLAGYYLERSAPALGPVRMQTEPRIPQR
jgi:hypothetical protein